MRARQFLDGTLPTDARTGRLVSKARSLYLFELINDYVVSGLDNLTDRVRDAEIRNCLDNPVDCRVDDCD